MQITITGSLGNISQPLTSHLVAKGHAVTVISQHPDRLQAIEALGAKALIGSVEDLDFLVKAFRGAEAVYTMIPPNFSVPDYGAFTRQVGANYAKAIEQSGVRYVVNLSSSGSPLAGKGPLAAYQNLEAPFDSLPGIHVLHLRPGGFYSNFYGSIGLIKHQGIIGNNFDETVSMYLSHPADIADAAAEALDTLNFQGRQVKYIVSDKKTGKEAAQLLGNAIGQPGLPWIQFSDEQLLGALVQNGFSQDAAQHYIVDMGVAMREGLLDQHYQQNTHAVVGNRRFEDFARTFAFAYHGQS
jgi:uncharacterized protein YbjT (DUF2867 family)